MNLEISFRIEIGKNIDHFEWPFKGQLLNVFVTNQYNSNFHYYYNSEGFLIFKHISTDTNNHLEFVQQNGIHSFIDSMNNTPYLFIYYSKTEQKIFIGKDFVGLSSVIIQESPFCISSSGINGPETPPGLTIIDFSSVQHEPVHQFSRNVTISDEAVFSTINLIKNALISSVITGYPVLFSGGLDSTLVAAALALKGATEIQLINFAANDSAPDRESSRKSLTDLRASFPNTNFILLEFTAPPNWMEERLQIAKALLPPQPLTEMGLNIEMTLLGGLYACDALSGHYNECYHSGLGADELFCGYMRMKSSSTIENEVNRLWERNGGRDDRIAMHCGKIGIFPFLSKEIMDIAGSLPESMLVRPSLERGKGEKWILRQLAEQLGLHSAAERPKQAMQFGSRVAKTKWRGSEEIPQSF